MKHILIDLITRIQRKLYQLQIDDYLTTLRKRCDCTGAILYKDCFIFDGHPNETERSIKIGNYTHVRGELQTLGHGGKITVGDYSYIGPNTSIWSGKSIFVGDRVLIGPNCCIFDNDIHPLNPEIRHKQFEEIVTRGQPAWVTLNDEEVVIKDDAWIGANVVVLKGITIGKGAIVGAGSVVTHDIPDYAIAHGNPAKVCRYIEDAKM